MKIYTYFIMFAILLGTASGGCSNNNPVQFSKEAQANQNSQEATRANSNAKTQSTAISSPANVYTLLELYLMEKIERDYMMAWFFKDIRIYRAKMVLIKNEITSKKPLSSHDTNRILLLEAGMNDSIRTFNQRNLFARTREVFNAAVRSSDYYTFKERIRSDYTLPEIERQGVPAQAISNNLPGFLGSIMKNGFQIENVDFLDRYP